MRRGVFLVLVSAVLLLATGQTDAGSVAATEPPVTVPTTAATTTDIPLPPITVNEFMPEDRGLSDCISAIPKPGCGSKARGGWRQTLVFLVIVGGLALIAWRVVAGSRSARAGG